LPSPADIQNSPPKLTIRQTDEFSRLSSAKKAIIRSVIEAGELTLEQARDLIAPEKNRGSAPVQAARISGFLGPALERHGVSLDKIAQTFADAIEADKKVGMHVREFDDRGNIASERVEVTNLGPDHKIRLQAVRDIAKMTPGMNAPTKLEVDKRTTVTTEIGPGMAAVLREREKELLKPPDMEVDAEYEYLDEDTTQQSEHAA